MKVPVLGKWFFCFISVLSAGLFCTTIQKGPKGGAIVSLRNSNAKVEILTHAASGAILIYTWDTELNSSQPVSCTPMVIGSGNVTVDLQPYPTQDDSLSSCSRFYGKADWLRGDQMRYGWLSVGKEQIRYEFNWQISLQAGKSGSSLFEKIEKKQNGTTFDETGKYGKN